MASYKTNVIEAIFDKLWDPTSNSLTRTIVTLEDVIEGINNYNQTISAGGRRYNVGNPANFFKDLVRNLKTINNNWPKTVLARGYTGQQTTGDGNSFEFIPLPLGQTEAFPSVGQTYPRDPQAPHYPLQSLSLSIESKILGRADETWLMQVAVLLHLVEAHLAYQSKHKFIQVSHMQTGIKQRGAEIDGMFLGKLANGNTVIITMEAKGKRDDILESQLLAQAKAALSMKSITNNFAKLASGGKEVFVIPMAMKILDDGKIYMAEYEEIKYGTTVPNSLTLQSESLYSFIPPVPGVNS